MHVIPNDHPDYEKEFTLHSDMKSSIFQARTKRERDIWVDRITAAKRVAKERRRKRKSIQLLRPLSPTLQSPDGDGAPPSLAPSSPTGAFPTEPAPPPTAPAEPTARGRGRRGGSRRSQRRAQHRNTAPLWIDDKKATKCLMKGCGKRFSLFNRRHHCRQCGWLICWKCVGYAPVKTTTSQGVDGWPRVIVCAQCYYEIVERFETGRLFPAEMIETYSLQSALLGASQLASPRPHSPPDDPANPTEQAPEQQAPSCSGQQRRYRVEDNTLRVVFASTTSSGGVERKYVQPKELFKPPENGALKKSVIPQKESACEASGKVYMVREGKKGKDQLRWARLTKEMFLQFYEAEFVSWGRVGVGKMVFVFFKNFKFSKLHNPPLPPSRTSNPSSPTSSTATHWRPKSSNPTTTPHRPPATTTPQSAGSSS